MDMLQHALISIRPVSDHLLVSLSRGWEGAARTRGMRRKKTQDIVFCVNFQAAKLHGKDGSLREVPRPPCHLLAQMPLPYPPGTPHRSALHQGDHCRWQLPCRHALGKAITRSRNHILPPPRTSSPVESISTTKTVILFPFTKAASTACCEGK